MWSLITAAPLLIVVLIVVGVTAHDLIQRKHAILRNFPILGHFRYLFESVGPELRQYIVTGNNEERPFSRDQRSWIYASSKSQNNYQGFGTDDELELSPNYMIIKHSARRSGIRSESHAALCKSTRRASWTCEGLPSEFSGEHLGYELWLAQWSRRRGFEPWESALRLPSEHR